VEIDLGVGAGLTGAGIDRQRNDDSEPVRVFRVPAESIPQALETPLPGPDIEDGRGSAPPAREMPLSDVRCSVSD
jgi:hypothetical protein